MKHIIYYICHDKDGTTLGEEEARAWEYVREYISSTTKTFTKRETGIIIFSFTLYSALLFIHMDGLGIFWLVWS